MGSLGDNIKPYSNQANGFKPCRKDSLTAALQGLLNGGTNNQFVGRWEVG
ncbi:hypothetical protein BH695_5010 [Microcystis aeruginosa PCC 7806SL]|uniref:Uncharacterized protein n=1 Tax=Microcystis aeruginosa PCC 7806SL TaxID=1903187 RepID=A0AB33BWW2_MICA7|nr:hypothetical protein BH695_5010 [Microcystis aeruginosa PCC 7806SL]